VASTPPRVMPPTLAPSPWPLLAEPGSAFDRPVAMPSFAMPRGATAPPQGTQGVLRVDPAAGESRFAVLQDDFGSAADPKLETARLPALQFQFVMSGSELLPARRGSIPGSHPYWEWVVLPGKAWLERDHPAWMQAVVPFALMERNANCVSYGMLALRVPVRGGRSQALWQVSSETCAYFKFDARGRAPLDFRPAPVATASAIRRLHREELAARMPTRPAAELRGLGVDPSLFDDPADVLPADMTAYGVVFNGIHYAGGCATRAGTYPFCDDLPLPSYSLAKSLVAGLGLARLEVLVPGAARVPVSSLVPACRKAGWGDVTILDTVDMATGRFDSPGPDADEDAAILSPLFLAEDHATRIAYACTRYPRKAAPGTTFAYHTSDAYVAVTAMNMLLRRHSGRQRDFYRDVVAADLWRPLALSPLIMQTRRTRDAVREPFGGWGLLLKRDDVARLGAWLERGDGRIDGRQVLDSRLLASALQSRTPGLPAGVPGLWYRGAFWSIDVAPYVGCDHELRVPFMSGFGGIVVALFPNGVVYYHFSDGGSPHWRGAIRGADAIRPLCNHADATFRLRPDQSEQEVTP